MQRAIIELDGQKFRRYRTTDTRTDFPRIIWATDEQQAARMAARYVGSEPELITVQEEELVLDLTPLSEAQIRKVAA